MHSEIGAVLSEARPPVAILGAGAPGSGKTHLLTPLGNALGYEVICVDDIREELTGDASNQAVNQEAWTIAYHRSSRILSKAGSVILDATNADAWRRPITVELYRYLGANTVGALFFQVSPSIALDRTAKRDRKVPKQIVYYMARNLWLHPPSEAEGFDFVVTLPQS